MRIKDRKHIFHFSYFRLSDDFVLSTFSLLNISEFRQGKKRRTRTLEYDVRHIFPPVLFSFFFLPYKRKTYTREKCKLFEGSDEHRFV